MCRNIGKTIIIKIKNLKIKKIILPDRPEGRSGRQNKPFKNTE